ncbi:unnamed protein product [Parnassius mnemosyne]|uniref:BPTI/Kunitz inhibitor domain-containing protein n=1 Tax=Parnassius mnemosyne TaxID=213953 RepID=A0AAV1K763_9NEOP
MCYDHYGVETGEGSVAEAAAEGGGSCATQAWGAWGPCSVTCGPGRAVRQRHYVWPARAFADACRALLTDYRRCHGPRAHCRVKAEYEAEPAEAHGPCAVSQWSEWSPCEGCGVRARTRHYLTPRARKRCHVGFRAAAVMSQAIPCDSGPCYKPTGALANATNFDWFFVDNPTAECPVSAWGEWSPCSSRCGRGRRVRGRLLVAQSARLQPRLTRHLLHLWNQRFAQLQHLELPELNATEEDPEIESMVQEHLERCQFTLTQQEALCDADDGCQVVTPQDVCSLPLSVGPCRGYEERWFYDTIRNECEPFGFTGCGGNANNFPTKEICNRQCKRKQNDIYNIALNSHPEIIFKKIKPTPSNRDNEVMQNDTPILADDVDCETGSWLGWSDCFGDCDYAIKLNYRLILQGVSGLGKPCSKLIKSRICKPGYCRKLFLVNNNSSVEFD